MSTRIDVFVGSSGVLVTVGSAVLSEGDLATLQRAKGIGIHGKSASARKLAKLGLLNMYGGPPIPLYRLSNAGSDVLRKAGL